MATLSPQAVTIGGVNATYAAAGASGDKVAPGDRVFLHVKNGAGSTVTVTIAANPTASGLTVTSPTVSVPASGDRFIGPLAKADFAAASDGLVAITYSSNTSVTVAALRI
jgi:hypothetical protein